MRYPDPLKSTTSSSPNVGEPRRQTTPPLPPRAYYSSSIRALPNPTHRSAPLARIRSARSTLDRSGLGYAAHLTPVYPQSVDPARRSVLTPAYQSGRAGCHAFPNRRVGSAARASRERSMSPPRPTGTVSRSFIPAALKCIRDVPPRAQTRPMACERLDTRASIALSAVPCPRHPRLSRRDSASARRAKPTAPPRIPLLTCARPLSRRAARLSAFFAQRDRQPRNARLSFVPLPCPPSPTRLILALRKSFPDVDLRATESRCAALAPLTGEQSHNESERDRHRPANQSPSQRDSPARRAASSAPHPLSSAARESGPAGYTSARSAQRTTRYRPPALPSTTRVPEHDRAD